MLMEWGGQDPRFKSPRGSFKHIYTNDIFYLNGYASTIYVILFFLLIKKKKKFMKWMDFVNISCSSQEDCNSYFWVVQILYFIYILY